MIDLDAGTNHIFGIGLFGVGNVLQVGDTVTVGNEKKIIISVTDADNAMVDSVWLQDSTNDADFSYQKSIWSVSDSEGLPSVYVDHTGGVQLSRGIVSTAPGTSVDLNMTAYGGDVNVVANAGGVVINGAGGVQLQVGGATKLQVGATGAAVLGADFYVTNEGGDDVFAVSSDGAVAVVASAGESVTVGSQDTVAGNGGNVTISAGSSNNAVGGNILIEAADGLEKGDIMFMDAFSATEPRLTVFGDGAIDINAAAGRTVELKQDGD
eukprot:COSAG05_NODE_1424_length_4925_cov_3.474720_2_plen_266_part_01